MNRRFRLNKRTDFERVRRTGQSYAHPLIVLVALPNDLPLSRFGVSASKAIGSAVARNRAKRRIRAILTQSMTQINTGHDLVFLARSAISNSSSQELTNAVHKLLLRAKLLAEF